MVLLEDLNKILRGNKEISKKQISSSHSRVDMHLSKRIELRFTVIIPRQIMTAISEERLIILIQKISRVSQGEGQIL